jgi:nicotinamide-nucleotide amidase
MHRTAAILSQGDEIVLGQTLNTNSKWLAERLMDRGILPVEHVSLPDDAPALADAFRRLARRVDLILCTGGLGPTDDDLTRTALAEALNEPLVEDAPALDQIRAWFAGRQRPMPDLNRVQALRPRSAMSLENSHGTAPGLFATLRVESHACDILCLPGPPRELFPMFDAHVAPRLAPPHDAHVRTWTIHTIGLGESDVATRLASSPVGNLMDRNRPTLVGTTASGGVVSARCRTTAPSADQAEAELADTVACVKTLLGTHAFADGPASGGSPHEALPAAVLAAMRTQRRTLAVAESCTAGLLGSMLGDIPGASDAFLGGAITYANALKSSLLRVPESLLHTHGAVSREVAAAMAAGGIDAFHASDCLAITGIAGPDGGTPAKPVGTVWIAHAHDGFPIDVRRFVMPSDRRSVREWAARTALAILWTHLAGSPRLPLLRQAPD